MAIKKDLILIGGGGHCASVIDVIETSGVYNIIGVLDREDKIGTQVMGYSIIGTDENIQDYAKDNVEFLITVGQIRSPRIRQKIFERIKANEGKLATLISPLAHVSAHAKVREGSVVMHGVIVNAGVIIGQNCIINTKATIEHGSTIGNDTHISTHTIINGDCKIGNRVFIGSGTIVNHGVIVSSDIIVSSGSLVRKSLVQAGVYFGNPVRYAKHS